MTYYKLMKFIFYQWQICHEVKQNSNNNDEILMETIRKPIIFNKNRNVEVLIKKKTYTFFIFDICL